MSLCPKYQIPGRENVLVQPEQVSRPNCETVVSNRALESGHVHLLGGGTGNIIRTVKRKALWLHRLPLFCALVHLHHLVPTQALVPKAQGWVLTRLLLIEPWALITHKL